MCKKLGDIAVIQQNLIRIDDSNKILKEMDMSADHNLVIKIQKQHDIINFFLYNFIVKIINILHVILKINMQ